MFDGVYPIGKFILDSIGVFESVTGLESWEQRLNRLAVAVASLLRICCLRLLMRNLSSPELPQ
jgi:hypothetical protein